MIESGHKISPYSFSWNGEMFDPFHERNICKETLAAAASFHTENDREAGRRRIHLNSLLQRMPLKRNQLIAMTFDSKYSLLFKNWIASVDYHGISVRERCIVFPMDEESTEIAAQEGFFFVYDPESKILQSTGSAAVYGDQEFAKHMLYQNAVISDLLACGVDLLFQDVDLVWINDPLPILDTQTAHVNFMFDGVNHRHRPLHANTGFMLLRNSPETRAFWEIVHRRAEQVLSYRSQQEPLNKILGIVGKRGLRIKILDEYDFLNGHMVQLDTPKKLSLADSFVVHCSWTANIEKKYQKMDEHGLWFVDRDGL